MQRMTTQRQTIRLVLEQADRPLSPQEIFSLAQAEAPQLGLATVYRTLNAFLDEGWLVAVDVPGEAPRYELAGKAHHHHFHCRACGRVYELHGCPGDLHALTPPGFRAEAHHLTISGLCAGCTHPRRGR